MSVIFVPEGLGSQDYPGDRTELVLLMFLALADALYLRLMQGIDFPPGTAFL